MTTDSELALCGVSIAAIGLTGGRWTEIGEDSFGEDERRITGLNRIPRQVPDWAEDLFRVARAAFIADKYTRRDAARDRWTRRIVSACRSRSTRGGRAQTASSPCSFQILTAEVWDVEFRLLAGRHVQEAIPQFGAERAGEVEVFSGGLDSLTWAAVRADADASRPMLRRERYALRLHTEWTPSMCPRTDSSPSIRR